MTPNWPTNKMWQKLFESTIRAKELAPWNWMGETDIFGVENPETGEIGFVSVMGEEGEHYAIAVYLGAEGLYSYWDFRMLASSVPFLPPEALLGMTHLQTAFEDRKTLHKKDRALIKNLGFKFRGENAWPMFRSYRPGCFPWYLEADETSMLLYALEQLPDLARRFETNPDLLHAIPDDNYLVRVRREKDGTQVWEDEIKYIARPKSPNIPLMMDMEALEHLKQQPKKRLTLQVDFFVFFSPVQEQEERPVFPHMLMIVESESGVVMASELLTPTPNMSAMWGSVPMCMAQVLARANIVPTTIQVTNPLLPSLLQPLARELNCKFRQVRSMPALEAAKESMKQFME